MLNFSDYATISGPTVAIGLYLVKSMRDSRIQRELQHEENKDGLQKMREEFGNRLTAVEVALEHVIGWRNHRE